MLNKEKHINKIIEAVAKNNLCDFKEEILCDLGQTCEEIECEDCNELFRIWANTEANRPEKKHKLIDATKLAEEYPKRRSLNRTLEETKAVAYMDVEIEPVKEAREMVERLGTLFEEANNIIEELSNGIEIDIKVRETEIQKKQ